MGGLWFGLGILILAVGVMALSGAAQLILWLFSRGKRAP